MCEQIYNTQYGTVEYKENDNVVLLTWKKKCSYDDFRNTTLSALTALQKYKNSSLVIDARNGFEDEPEDVEWGFHILLPAMAKTTCRFVIFIMEAVNDIQRGNGYVDNGIFKIFYSRKSYLLYAGSKYIKNEMNL